MYIVADSFDGGVLQGLVPEYLDRPGFENIAIIELELTDLANRISRPTLKLGLPIIEHYGKNGRSVVVLLDPQNCQNTQLMRLVKKYNIALCEKPPNRARLVAALDRVL